MLFGQEEVGKLNSTSQDMQKSIQTRSQSMCQLQANVKQWKQMINEWDRIQNEVKHVKNHSTKFHLHMIRNENFTRHVSRSLKKNPKMTKQQTKIPIK